MSRIDEALRRARERSAEAAAPAQPTANEHVFVSPWEFEAGEGRAVPATAPQPPAEAPSRAISGPPAVPILAVAPAEATKAPPADEATVPAPDEVSRAGRIVSAARTPGLAIEQYRRLGATLHQAQIEKSIRVVMLTSAVAGEGKTLTAANLALTLSESYGRNTLLIDADLRRPTLHTLFDVPNVTGLSDGLREDATQRLSVQRVSPRLSLLTAGRPDGDPTSLLTSEMMRKVVEEAAVTFDWVVIDTPPVGLITDAKLLAGMVDTVLFVIQAASTPYEVARRAIEALGKNRVMGVVLNRVETEHPLGRDKYYRYDYYYGQGGEKRTRKRR